MKRLLPKVIEMLAGVVLAVCLLGLLFGVFVFLTPLVGDMERDQMKQNWASGWSTIKQSILGIMVALILARGPNVSTR